MKGHNSMCANTDALAPHLVAPQVQFVHEEGQVIQPKLRVIAHKEAAALLHSAVRNILRASDYRR